jgi:aldehyde:ferredoxin oxidoreductase
MVRAATGWDTSLYELMKASERCLSLIKAYNVREGFTPDDDVLPERLFEPKTHGPGAGKKVIDKERFYQLLRLYHQMFGWDPDSGRPSTAKLIELDLEWVDKILKKKVK